MLNEYYVVFEKGSAVLCSFWFMVCFRDYGLQRISQRGTRYQMILSTICKEDAEDFCNAANSRWGLDGKVVSKIERSKEYDNGF